MWRVRVDEARIRHEPDCICRGIRNIAAVDAAIRIAKRISHGCASSNPADRLPAISTSAADLLSEFTFGPRRFTAGIPLGEEAQRISIRHGEAPYQATTHTESVQSHHVARRSQEEEPSDIDGRVRPHQSFPWPAGSVSWMMLATR